MYPENDEQFVETTLKGVTHHKDGSWSMLCDDGWSFYVPADSPVTPEVGMVARFYGKGLCTLVRGLFLGGQKVYYRTEAEDRIYYEEQTYGKDAADWLARWDEGKIVWSIAMGGIGPGYEQAIQITAAETLRHMLDVGYDHEGWSDPDVWKANLDQVEAFSHSSPIIDRLGISGNQWGAALNLATSFYQYGPRAVLTSVDDDRRIMVSRNFPSY